MKTKNMFWVALSMMAALVMTACSSSDDSMTETPVTPSTTKKIPYTVTVGGDAASTRATVDSDNRTLKFATGDKLYISGTDIKGVLNITSGVGESSGATFSGDLEYSGSGSPADGLSLTATLVSAQQTVGTQVSVDGAGAVTVNYPTTAYCATINDAVQQYSRLTGTSTYGTKAFSLTQQTAFLNFVITFEDGTTTGTELSAVVSNNSLDICTANVTTTTEEAKVVAKFVLPVAASTVLSSATVTMGTKAALDINNATLTGKVYNVKKTQASAPSYPSISTVTTGDYGKVVCAAGHLHDANTPVPAGCTGVGVIAKVTDGGHGLIMALQDADEEGWGNIFYYENVNYAGSTLKRVPSNRLGGLPSYTTLGSIAVSNWCVASKDDYIAMFTNLGSQSYGEKSFDNNVNAKITSAGGTALSDGDSYWGYWCTTDYDDFHAWCFKKNDWTYEDWEQNNKISSKYLRPVLGF